MKLLKDIMWKPSGCPPFWVDQDTGLYYLDSDGKVPFRHPIEGNPKPWLRVLFDVSGKVTT